MGALSLAATRLVVLDMHRDKKDFTLLTLPDVAKETADFLRAFVVPQLLKPGAHLKLALL
jgi:hypothetical protein